MTPAQVILSWAIQRGNSFIPKTANEGRLSENFRIAPLYKKHFMIIDYLAATMETGILRFLDSSQHLGQRSKEFIGRPIDMLYLNTYFAIEMIFDIAKMH